MATTRKARTPKPYHRKADGWWYACSKQFVSLTGTDRVKLIHGPNDTANRHAALVELQKVLSQVNSDSQRDDMTIGVLAAKYLEWLQSTKKVCKKQYVSVSHFLAHPDMGFVVAFGNMTVAEFNDVAFPKMDKWLEVNSPDGNGAGNWAAVDTVRKAIKSVKAMFNYGVTYYKQSPPETGKYPLPEGEPRVTYFTPEQEAAILDALTLDRFIDQGEFADFFTVLIETGARTLVEAAAFTFEKLEWKDGLPFRFDMGIVKKRQRIIYLTPKAQAIIMRLHTQYKTGHVFRNSDGNPWTDSAVQRRFRLVRNWLIKTKTELELTTAHVCYSARHTFIVRMLIKTNGDIALVAELAGNSIAVIERHYKKWGANVNRCLTALGHTSEPQLRIA